MSDETSGTVDAQTGGLTVILYADIFTVDRLKEDQDYPKIEHLIKTKALMHPKEDTSKFHFLNYSKVPSDILRKLIEVYETSQDAVEVSTWFVNDKLDKTLDPKLKWRLFCVSASYIKPDKPPDVLKPDKKFGLATFSYEDFLDVIDSDYILDNYSILNLVNSRIGKWLQYLVGSQIRNYALIYVHNNRYKKPAINLAEQIDELNFEEYPTGIRELDIKPDSLCLIALNNGEFQFLYQKTNDIVKYLTSDSEIFYLD